MVGFPPPYVNHALEDAPKPRKVKVIHIGGAACATYSAIRLQGLARGHKAAENVELICYDKNPTHGGTWIESRYPGCGCDVPSHLYCWSFERNPSWTKTYSDAPEIWNYFDKVYKKYGVEKFVRFSTRVNECVWNDETGKWKVFLKDVNTGEAFEDECDVLIHGAGIMNNWRFADIKGLKDFQGKLMHSAVWDQSYDYKDKTVLVIGTGASAVQIVPTMQPVVKQITVFQRSAVWILKKRMPVYYTPEEIKRFETDPEYLEQYYHTLWDQLESMYPAWVNESEAQKGLNAMVKAEYEERIKDPVLREKLTPDFRVGCRRVTPSDTYLEAIQAPNAEIVFEKISHITKDGIVTVDGKEYKADVLVCATGFDCSFVPNWKMVGKGGVVLSEMWHDYPDNYKSIMAPNFPNYFITCGPNWPTIHNSLLPLFEEVIDQIFYEIQRIQVYNLHSIEPRADVVAKQMAECQEYLKNTVSYDRCNAWYKARDGVRVSGVWPGDTASFIETMRNVPKEELVWRAWRDGKVVEIPASEIVL